MTRASENPFPSVLLDHTSNTVIATPDVFETRFFADADGALSLKDSSGTVSGVGSNFATSAVAIHAAATDPHSGYVLESIVDASYDLIVGNGANSVTRLALGSSNTLLGSSNSLAYVPVGTSTFAPDSLSASAAPTVTDDFTAGWRRGSKWMYNGNVYICTDETPGAAVWKLVGAGGGALGDLSDVTVSGSETSGQSLQSDGAGGFAFDDQTGGGSITVEEEDGTPSVSGVSTVKVTNGTLTDNGGGSVSIAISGGSASVPPALNVYMYETFK